MKKSKHSSLPDSDDLLDEAQEQCRAIQTLAGLLMATGQRAGTEVIEAQLVANTGALIEQEARQLQKVLDHLYRRAAQ